MATTIPTAAYVTAIILAFIYVIYRWSLPSILPGNIPYDEKSAKRPFGDIPDVMGYTEPMSFFLDRCHQLNAPIFQVFVEPFGRPLLVIADAREYAEARLDEQVLTRPDLMTS